MLHTSLPHGVEAGAEIGGREQKHPGDPVRGREDGVGIGQVAAEHLDLGR